MSESEHIIAQPGELGLIIRHDPRSLANYPIEPWLEVKLQERGPLEVPQTTYHRIARCLNQNPYPACVGFANRTTLEATPVPVSANVGPDGMMIYTQAQLEDGIPLPHDGTSLVAGANYLKRAGFYKEFRWIANIRDLALYVLLFGPVIMGTVWTAGMDAYDSRFVIKPTGAVRGGHAWTVFGYDAVTGYFIVQNTWGLGWANKGRVWIWWKDLEQVCFYRAGECMAPVEPL